jgi:hypothetical protein
METTVPPLAKKLKLKPGTRAAVVNAPPGYLEQLVPPDDVEISETLDGGPFDWIQVFVRTSAQLAAIVDPLSEAIAPTGHIWISYPKGSSKLQTDLTRDKGWEPLAGRDLMWLSLVSLDGVWSAFGLRPYKQGETRQTFR